MYEELEVEIGKTDIMKMESHDQTQSFEDELRYNSIIILILTLLRNTSYYKNEESTENPAPKGIDLTNQELKVAEIVDHLLRVQNFNTHPILTTNVGQNRVSNKKEFNVGLSRLGDCINIVIGSHFNHSCNPNTLRINTVCPPQTILVASRNIPKGKLKTNTNTNYQRTVITLLKFLCYCLKINFNCPLYLIN